ncbi:thioredoxin domain-containing protein [Nocardioides sp. JQ2195]|uniref:DsbA family protein n=1 Tax=Nocardioides sp. JQ2195 TaxID=2592334 RepID=UPI00143EA298|nr:thioredoxin domain-containing protein [Nocardioides sp. JQ2195]QIX26035.1 thioredoxin domain-containing protein [Nocardioides sp. JQ2195]
MPHANDRRATPGKRNLLVGGGIVLLLVAIVVIGWAVQSQRDTTGEDARNPGESATTNATGASSDAASAGVADTYGLGVGDPEAPVKVEVFEDFQCPFCMQFEVASRDQLHEAAANGDAYVVYRPFAFLNDYSERALNAFGVVLDASGGEVALAFHDLLFDRQPSESGPWPSDDELVDLAVEAGADEDDVRDGIENHDFAQWVVNGNEDTSKRGVHQTPTIVVDGEPVTGNSIQELVDNTISAIDAG